MEHTSNGQQNQKEYRRLKPQYSRSISEYEILHKLGEGSYGIAYKVWDKMNGEILAMK